jgi:hypothetical protein
MQKGDTPEPIYVLHLDALICITGDDMADASDRFDEVQVVPGKAPESALKAMVNRRVRLGLYNGMAAENGHHHRPLVAWVNAVAPAAAEAPGAMADDPTAEQGTAATTIRAFYAALHAGQGDTAAQMVVPEKRGAGPFSGAALSAFYGALREPVTLQEVTRWAPIPGACAIAMPRSPSSVTAAPWWKRRRAPGAPTSPASARWTAAKRRNPARSVQAARRFRRGRR